MTPQEIDLIIAARDRLTDRRDEQVDWEAVRHFDEVLATVPPGERNDVDLLLGRACAVLPPRTDYNLNDMADQHEDMLDWKRSQGDLDI